MLIDGKDYKISVLILFMEHEKDVTMLAFRTLLDGLEEGVTVSLLLNGGSDDGLKEYFSRHEAVKYYESDTNLGVAGGRNVLLRTKECQDSDIVFILDNDVVPPYDYVRGLATFLLNNKDAGVVGALVADVKSCKTFDKLEFKGDDLLLNDNIFKLSNKDIKDYILKDFSSKRLFHIGVDPDFYYSYLSPRPTMYVHFRGFARLFGIRIKLKAHPFLVHNPEYIKWIRNGKEKYESSNVVGCSQAFRRELLDEIGYLDDRFSPYGFEDTDFCYRACKAGYKNYIDTSTWLLHGTDTRHKKRDYNKLLKNQYRARTILASLFFPGPSKFKRVILKLIFVSFFLGILGRKPMVVSESKARFEGYKQGLGILKENPLPVGVRD